MGDGLQTPFDKPAMSAPGSEGDSVTQRGSEPLIDPNAGGPSNALDPFWKNPVVPVPGGEESGNSVSSLPARPNRFEPTETPPEPPNLTDRRPGTIDKQ